MAVIILNKAPKPAQKKQIEGKVIDDPKSIENEARRTLKNITKPIQLELEFIIDNMRDKSAREVGKELEAVKKNYDFQLETTAEQIAENWVGKVNRYNKEKFMSHMRKALGIDIGAIVDEAMKDELEIMVMENASYIKSIPNYLVGHVADRVVQHFKGIPMPENRTLRQQIKEEFKVSDGRAKVLARDQTSKMNTSISAIRQVNLGIDCYVWKTVEDERVVGKPGGVYPKTTKLHKNHYIMQGLLCKWADPNVYSDDKGATWKPRTAQMPHNHPGDDIMCRCRPAPFIDIEKLKVKWSE
jgi:uncharacterized protein with gpF-like domain